MNQLGKAKRTLIIRLMVEGMSAGDYADRGSLQDYRG